MEYVKGITSDNELKALCDRLNLKVDGILLLEEFEKLKNKNGTYIVLLGKSDVGHWVCVDRGYYFDSYGLPPFKGINIRDFNAKQYQDVYGEYCGPYCVLFLYCKQKGKMHLLKRFVDLDVDVIE